jgi:hypothetical protein
VKDLNALASTIRAVNNHLIKELLSKYMNSFSPFERLLSTIGTRVLTTLPKPSFNALLATQFLTRITFHRVPDHV